MNEFQLHFTKEGVDDAKAKVDCVQVTSLSWAEQKIPNDALGNVVTIPAESGYGSSIHKIQSMTEAR